MQNGIDKMVANWVEFTKQIIQPESKNTEWTIGLVTLLLLLTHQETHKSVTKYITGIL